MAPGWKGIATVAALAAASPCERGAAVRDRAGPVTEVGGARDAAPLQSLPTPTRGTVTLDDVLARRRSSRDFAAMPLSAAALGQLCWAAQGITEPAAGLRAAPSAGALYPLELYVVGPAGVHRYRPREHALERVTGDDRRDPLARATRGQEAVRGAAIALVLTAVVPRTSAKYGTRAERYVQLEAGHAAQNILLEATALDLAAVPIGSFDDEEVRRVVGAAAQELPLYVLAVGHVATR